MPRRKLRIILRIGPCDFRRFPIRVKFTDRKENMLEHTRGEGQALSFVLEDGDFSPNFHDALKSGEVLEVFKAENWELRIVED